MKISFKNLLAISVFFAASGAIAQTSSGSNMTAPANSPATGTTRNNTGGAITTDNSWSGTAAGGASRDNSLSFEQQRRADYNRGSATGVNQNSGDSTTKY